MTFDITRINNFLSSIGISLIKKQNSCGFLSNVRIHGTTIYFDDNDASVVGNILHEAGHIAVMPSMFRQYIDGDIQTTYKHMDKYMIDHPDALCVYPEHPIARGILQCGETEAIAWSYAATIYLEIDASSIFKDSPLEGLELDLQCNTYFGINGLVAAGMADNPRRRTEHSFPNMKKWMQI